MIDPKLEDLYARRTLHAAFERVRANAGCRGADGVTVGRFAERLEEELDHLEDRLRSRRYHPYPLLSFPIPKPRHGIRHLAVPTVRDRVAQTAAYLVTKDRFDAELEQCSYAFRPGRSVKSAIRRVDELRREGYRFIVDADVEDFFGQVTHDRLLGRLRRMRLDPCLVALFESWIGAEVYDGQRVYRLDRGIAQGSVVSPMLANLFLDDLDENLAIFGKTVVRYADNLLILCKTAAEAGEALELTDYLLAELELRLNREKTATGSFEQGFKFLGAVFLKDAIYLPFEPERPEPSNPVLPPPLDLLAYLELREKD
ncbi:MAG TPA: reverse transcriptase domain-containing protein [Thermoanaerobaculia bacterium]